MLCSINVKKKSDSFFILYLPSKKIHPVALKNEQCKKAEVKPHRT